MLMIKTNKSTILTVSGDTGLLSALKGYLHEEGYHITNTVTANEELKEVIKEVNPGIIIVDINMPWLGGIELSLRIRQWSSVPVIMLTTWGAKKGEVRGLDLGSSTYLTDSLSRDELLKLIEKAKSGD